MNSETIALLMICAGVFVALVSLVVTFAIVNAEMFAYKLFMVGIVIAISGVLLGLWAALPWPER